MQNQQRRYLGSSVTSRAVTWPVVGPPPQSAGPRDPGTYLQKRPASAPSMAWWAAAPRQSGDRPTLGGWPAYRNGFRSRGSAIISFKPLVRDADSLFRRQPGPVRAAGANGDPDSIAVNMLFDCRLPVLRHQMLTQARVAELQMVRDSMHRLQVPQSNALPQPGHN
jgi:hypothetical protein